MTYSPPRSTLHTSDVPEWMALLTARTMHKRNCTAAYNSVKSNITPRFEGPHRHRDLLLARQLIVDLCVALDMNVMNLEWMWRRRHPGIEPP